MFRFKVDREEKNIWQIFCANNQFDLAKKYSRGNEACYNQVNNWNFRLIENKNVHFCLGFNKGG